MNYIDEMDNLVNNLEVKVNENQEPVVSGRALHEGLEIGTQYTKWFDRMCEYGFEEKQDYIAISQKRLTAQGNETTYTDHVLKLDMAKEIAMLQRSERGKEIRQYFIKVEKEWNSPEKVMARAVLMANKQLDITTKKLEITTRELEKATTTIGQFASSKNTLLVRETAKAISKSDTNIVIGERRLYKKMRLWGWVCQNSTEPKQYAIDRGYLEVTEGHKETSKGVFTYRTTRVTGKGQIKIVEKLLKEIETENLLEESESVNQFYS